MTASTLVTIFCDEAYCGQWEDAGIADTAREARARLKSRGWAVGVQVDGQRLRADFCPRHAQCTEVHPDHPESRCRDQRFHRTQNHHSLMHVWPVTAKGVSW